MDGFIDFLFVNRLFLGLRSSIIILKIFKFLLYNSFLGTELRVTLRFSDFLVRKVKASTQPGVRHKILTNFGVVVLFGCRVVSYDDCAGDVYQIELFSSAVPVGAFAACQRARDLFNFERRHAKKLCYKNRRQKPFKTAITLLCFKIILFIFESVLLIGQSFRKFKYTCT